ncbi:MAG: hypothetical protein KDH89_17650 [Anaerolineae bacterium]|nr:hypothetical protein [Anaerolineae bacterium]
MTWRVSSADRKSWEYPMEEIQAALARKASGAESKKIIRAILASRGLHFDDPLTTQGRKRVTFKITSAGYVPEYAVHESTARRRQHGERVAEVEVDFDPPWDHTGPTAYRILLDADAITKMEFLGVRSAAGLVGRTATVETDDVQSLLQPVRLIDIH